MGSILGLSGNTKPLSILVIAIATTLSGREYILFASVTDDEDGVKY